MKREREGKYKRMSKERKKNKNYRDWLYRCRQKRNREDRLKLMLNLKKYRK